VVVKESKQSVAGLFGGTAGSGQRLCCGDEAGAAHRDVRDREVDGDQGVGARGYKAVDIDDHGLSEWVAVPLDEPTGLGPGKDWVWREDRIQELLSSDDAEVLFLSGCSPNQGKFYPQFDHIVLLTAPPAVLVERLASRTTNPYGKHPDEVARVLALQQTVEPLLRGGAALEVDTSVPLDQVVATVLRLVQSPPSSTPPE
jgi:hypothetical protein